MQLKADNLVDSKPCWVQTLESLHPLKAWICQHLWFICQFFGNWRISINQRGAETEDFLALVFHGQTQAQQQWRESTDTRKNKQLCPVTVRHCTNRYHRYWTSSISPLRIICLFHSETFWFFSQLDSFFFHNQLRGWLCPWVANQCRQGECWGRGIGWSGGKQCRSRDPSFHIPPLFPVLPSFNVTVLKVINNLFGSGH